MILKLHDVCLPSLPSNAVYSYIYLVCFLLFSAVHATGRDMNHTAERGARQTPEVSDNGE
jgi:hypothetical protein